MSAGESEYREDPLTGKWVILAPDRGSRPSDFSRDQRWREAVPGWDSDCPFCPGNEDALTPIHDETAALSAEGYPESAHDVAWQVRAVANKFPAVTLREGSVSAREDNGLGRRMPGHGVHEVIVEHPRHDILFHELAVADTHEVVRMWRRRYAALLDRPGIEAVVLFRNHGPGAGTSLLHPHSQIVATSVAPPFAERLRECARNHHIATETCLLCDYLQREEAVGERLLFATDNFVVAAPYAPDSRCELLILPRNHTPDITAMTDAESEDLASVLIRAYGMLDAALSGPDSNLVFHAASRRHRDEPYSHWHARLRPRIGTPAGFELGSGISITPSLPERDAAVLRRHLHTTT